MLEDLVNACTYTCMNITCTCTKNVHVYGPELLATDQPTGSWLVASSLFLSACPLGAGAFV